jgi:hypothetical protein
MEEENSGMEAVQREAAKGGDVLSAVDRVLDGALKELDDAIAESERDLAEADALYEEVENDVSHRGAEDDNDESRNGREHRSKRRSR